MFQQHQVSTGLPQQRFQGQGSGCDFGSLAGCQGKGHLLVIVQVMNPYQV